MEFRPCLMDQWSVESGWLYCRMKPAGCVKQECDWGVPQRQTYDLVSHTASWTSECDSVSQSFSMSDCDTVSSVTQLDFVIFRAFYKHSYGSFGFPDQNVPIETIHDKKATADSLLQPLKVGSAFWAFRSKLTGVRISQHQATSKIRLLIRTN